MKNTEKDDNDRSESMHQDINVVEPTPIGVGKQIYLDDPDKTSIKESQRVASAVLKDDYDIVTIEEKMAPMQ